MKTAKMREQEANQRAARLGPVPIRVQLPNGLTLQVRPSALTRGIRGPHVAFRLKFKQDPSSTYVVNPAQCGIWSRRFRMLSRSSPLLPTKQHAVFWSHGQTVPESGSNWTCPHPSAAVSWPHAPGQISCLLTCMPFCNCIPIFHQTAASLAGQSHLGAAARWPHPTARNSCRPNRRLHSLCLMAWTMVTQWHLGLG